MNIEAKQKPLNILIVDDDDGDRKQITRVINEAQPSWKCTEAGSIKAALAACNQRAFDCATSGTIMNAHVAFKKGPFDCAIVDYQLPGEDGLAGITAMHGRFPFMAIIMATGKGDEAIATEALRLGALDYLRKKDIAAQTIWSVENAVQKATRNEGLAQQRQELEVFSRTLVHDLKAPLDTMLGFATLIQDGIRERKLEPLSAYCDPLIRGIERMEALIDALSSYTEADARVDFKPTEMRRVILDTLFSLKRLIDERGARVTYGKMPVVFGTAQLGQLLQNLVNNAIKYCEAEVPVVHVAATLKGNMWLFTVTDNGIGIPEKHYREVFEPFTRLHGYGKYKGTGLGLATCKKIVERHGGSISCESKKGQGTTFSFTLRAA
jgi:signal transduction histidine kinase